MRREVGGREVGRREKFWGKKKAGKINKFGQGGCVFGSSQNGFNGLSSTGALVAAGSLQPYNYNIEVFTIGVLGITL
jgi:hypothetical protein